MNISTIFRAYIGAVERHKEATASLVAVKHKYVFETLGSIRYNRLLQKWTIDAERRLRQSEYFARWLQRDGMVASPPWYSYVEGTKEYQEMQALKRKVEAYALIDSWCQKYAAALDYLVGGGASDFQDALAELLLTKDILWGCVDEYAKQHYAKSKKDG